MTVNQVFPFEYIDKNSKVIIYGLGTIGRGYIEQVQVTNWCEIVGVSDVNCEMKVQGYSFLRFDQLDSMDADYIVIAIATISVVRQVYKQLIELGIPDSKIISTLNRTHQNYQCVSDRADKTDKLQILIRSSGGLGDCIINYSLYKRITDMLQNADIDIWCKTVYGKALYANKKMVRSIIDDQNVVDYDFYDLVLLPEYSVNVVKYNEEKCVRHSPELTEKIQLLKETYDDLSSDILYAPYRRAFQLRRAMKKGWNRYRAIGHGDILNLNADMVEIDLQESYLSEYNKLGLGSYITINRGADKPCIADKIQMKVWPLEYYEKLICILKEKYPQYEIVQLGSNETNPISGVDRHIKGQSLELVKYILKYSALHFDCEGGLTHLATALGTKCAVVFGPTPIEFFSYPQNINITAGKCHNCMELSKNWQIECMRGEEEFECMYGITPQMVFERISEYLSKLENS